MTIDKMSSINLAKIFPDKTASEVARLVIAEPDLFEECYPKVFNELVITNNNQMVEDPMEYVALVREWWEALPQWYLDAINESETMIREQRLKELFESLESMLFPPHPFPNAIIQKAIDKYRLSFLAYHSKIEDQLKNLERNYIDKTSNKSSDYSNDESFKSFEDLFIKGDIEECIDALRRYRPEKPVLGAELNWIGSRKDRGVLVAWIERMESMASPKIRRLGDRKKLVSLLNNYFKNLNMGKCARVFNNQVDHEVEAAFKALIPY